MKIRDVIVAVILLAAAPAFGADHQFTKGEAVMLQPDQGYILVRTFNRSGRALSGTLRSSPVLIRVLDENEMQLLSQLVVADPEGWTEKYPSNVVEPLANRPYAEANGEAFLLTSLKPGTYVLGGVAVSNWLNSTGTMAASLCMGTVKFDVKPGIVTDLGAILDARDDEPTAIPELSKIVLGKSSGFQSLADDIAIRPAASATEAPQPLRALPIVPADYKAVDPFPNYIGAAPGRLAPLPGVLDYDKDGNVVDLKSHSVRQQ